MPVIGNGDNMQWQDLIGLTIYKAEANATLPNGECIEGITKLSLVKLECQFEHCLDSDICATVYVDGGYPDDYNEECEAKPYSESEIILRYGGVELETADHETTGD